MKTADAPTFADRLDRFVRWFLTVSPDSVVELGPAIDPKLRSRIVAHRKPVRLLPQHSGPVRVATKGKP